MIRRLWHIVTFRRSFRIQSKRLLELDVVEHGLELYRESLEADLAECYRLSGADPDGDEDWRLAPYVQKGAADACCAAEDA